MVRVRVCLEASFRGGVEAGGTEWCGAVGLVGPLGRRHSHLLEGTLVRDRDGASEGGTSSSRRA